MNVEEYLNQLNESQREAVVYNEGPSLVVAGAGSGKTRVLTYKIAYLLQLGLPPYSILALTFTNKAAREMKERIAAITGDQTARRLWMGTFHSIFSRILRNEAEHIGYPSNFTIYDATDSKSLLKSIIKEMQLDDKVYRLGMVQSRISNAKNSLITYTAYEQNKELVESDMNAKVPLLREIYKRYQSRCLQAGAMDFDDLLLQTNILFRDHPAVLEKYRNFFRYVLVDEYQDTNFAQHLIVQRLCERHGHICVVGDDAQSIYSFRGANIDNILQFKNLYTGCRIFKLERNYRSTQNILDAANAVIRNNRGRKEKTLWTANGEGDKIRFKQFDQSYEEADFIVKDILAKGYPYEDCAVLYRTNAQSRLIEERCIFYNVPYRLVGGVNFYQRKEIKDVLAYLKTIANGRDDLAVSRIVNVPKRGIGATSIGKVTIFASANGYSLYDAMLRAKVVPGLGKAAEKIGTFTDFIEEMRGRMKQEDYTIKQLLEDVLEESGYRRELEAEGEVEGQSRLENVEELVNKAVAYWEKADEQSLDEFLEEVALVADVDQLDQSEARVTLMTLHSAKGLEFENVYLSGMEDGLFPSYMTIISDDRSDLEEERRLCHVGITRAKKHLTLTSARMRMVNGETRYCKVSRFVEEIPEELLETSRLEPRRSGISAREKLEGLGADTGLPWNQPKKPAGISKFGRSENTYASKTSTLFSGSQAFAGSSLSGKNPGFGKAFTVEKKGLDYVAGDRVSHVKFGQGTVKEVKDGARDYEVTVEFDTAGTKKMFASFAKLKKI